MWLVESGNALPRETTSNALALRPSDIPRLEYLYRRTKVGVSPPDRSNYARMQEDDTNMEPMYGHRNDLDEDDPAEFGLGYDAVSVPIRTFPSQFAGQHNPSGTFIPVETIVVNSGQKGETLNELFASERAEHEESSHAEGDEQKGGGKLLLRLRLPKKKMSPDDLELLQPSPMAIRSTNRGFLPSTFTIPDPISKEVIAFEQFDHGHLQQPESTIGSHCIPVPTIPVS
jgi:hypothetical protein